MNCLVCCRIWVGLSILKPRISQFFFKFNISKPQKAMHQCFNLLNFSFIKSVKIENWINLRFSFISLNSRLSSGLLSPSVVQFKKVSNLSSRLAKTEESLILHLYYKQLVKMEPKVYLLLFLQHLIFSQTTFLPFKFLMNFEKCFRCHQLFVTFRKSKRVETDSWCSANGLRFLKRVLHATITLAKFRII